MYVFSDRNDKYDTRREEGRERVTCVQLNMDLNSGDKQNKRLHIYVHSGFSFS